MLADKSLLIIDSDRDSRSVVEETLTPLAESITLVGAAADFPEGMRLIGREPPSIVILEVRDLEKGMQEVKQLVSSYPEISVFVTSREKDPDWILRLIRAGAAEYLTKPVVATELTEAITKVFRQRLTRSAGSGKKGRVISVYNPCAGMGTTTIAVNIAAALAAAGKKVALVDLNLISGDVPAFLDLNPRYTLASAIAKKGSLDGSFLNSILVPHSCGIHVLGGPGELHESGKVGPDLVKEVLSVLPRAFDYTVVDAAGGVYGCNLAAFSISHRVLFNTVLSLPALNNAKRYLSTMEEEGVGEDRVRLVVNRYIPKDEIKVADAEKILKRKAYEVIPNAFADVRNSINRGQPLVASTPRSPVARAIEELAQKLAQEGAKQYALEERKS